MTFASSCMERSGILSYRVWEDWKEEFVIFDRNRNAFLCGFALFLYVMLQRFETLVGDLGKLEKRQAQRAGNSEYLYNFLLVSFLLTYHDPFTRNHPFSPHPLPLHCLPFISTITLFHHFTTILILIYFQDSMRNRSRN